MKQGHDHLDFLHFVNKIGYNIGKATPQHLDLHYQQHFDFAPDLAMFIASYTVKKTFRRQTSAPTSINNSICFYFKNVFDDGGPAQDEKPFVRALPPAMSYPSVFKKGAHVKVVCVFVSIDYLKSFLKEDAERFQYMFDDHSHFLIEEIMTDDIIRTVNDIVKKEDPGVLAAYHYKLKVMELLFHLFKSLSRREQAVHQKLSEKDITAIYKVRNKILASLDQPSTIAELKQLAEMNELKMRKIFIQVFGMGIYDYYQHFRMQEAARLMREEKLSVSEAGYQIGFENLSHFSRTFEKYIGKKPKKYSSEL